ncbi:hypothetical protein J6590_099935 [Homalodisca vitripennis]|nr:hypothetical protein J6590_099935 [Homalodisca vitripennis]
MHEFREESKAMGKSIDSTHDNIDEVKVLVNAQRDDIDKCLDVIDNLKVENLTFDDGLSAATGFARYYSSVYDRGEFLDPDMINKSPVMNGVNNFNLRSISVSEVSAAIRKLPSKRSYGPDLIPNYTIKGCSEFVERPLCHIFNLCLVFSGLLEDR